jgi:hypothetical protein
MRIGILVPSYRRGLIVTTLPSSLRDLVSLLLYHRSSDHGVMTWPGKRAEAGSRLPYSDDLGSLRKGCDVQLLQPLRQL